MDIREILLFDEVQVMHLDELHEQLPAYEQASVAYLRDRGFIQEAPGTFGDLFDMLQIKDPIVTTDIGRGDLESPLHYGWTVNRVGTTIGFKIKVRAPNDNYYSLDGFPIRHIRLPPSAIRMIAAARAAGDSDRVYTSVVQSRNESHTPKFSTAALTARVERFAPRIGQDKPFAVDLLDLSDPGAVRVGGTARGLEIQCVWHDGESASLDFRATRPSPQDTHPVLDVVLRAIPVPASALPLDEAMDIKSQLESQLGRLHLWIRGLFLTERLSTDRLEIDIQEMIDAYETEMKALRVEYEWTTLRVVLSVPLEIVQKIASLKLAEVVDALYAAKLRRAKLLTAEAKAPGREIAYISSLRTAFEGL